MKFKVKMIQHCQQLVIGIKLLKPSRKQVYLELHSKTLVVGSLKNILVKELDSQ